MKIESNLPRKILEKLYNDYYPEPCLIVRLSDDLGMKGKEKSVLAAGHYLEGKGLIIEDRTPKDRELRWRISPEGVDFLEGKSLI